MCLVFPNLIWILSGNGQLGTRYLFQIDDWTQHKLG